MQVLGPETFHLPCDCPTCDGTLRWLPNQGNVGGRLMLIRTEMEQNLCNTGWPSKDVLLVPCDPMFVLFNSLFHCLICVDLLFCCSNRCSGFFPQIHLDSVVRGQILSNPIGFPPFISFTPPLFPRFKWYTSERNAPIDLLLKRNVKYFNKASGQLITVLVLIDQCYPAP